MSPALCFVLCFNFSRWCVCSFQLRMHNKTSSWNVYCFFFSLSLSVSILIVGFGWKSPVAISSAQQKKQSYEHINSSATRRIWYTCHSENNTERVCVCVCVHVFVCVYVYVCSTQWNGEMQRNWKWSLMCSQHLQLIYMNNAWNEHVSRARRQWWSRKKNGTNKKIEAKKQRTCQQWDEWKNRERAREILRSRTKLLPSIVKYFSDSKHPEMSSFLG